MVTTIKTCSTCSLFERSKTLSAVGYCTKHQEPVRAKDTACLNQKQCRSVIMISESGWLQDKPTNTVYRQSHWEVVGSTGNLYQVSLDDRKPYPQCICKAGLHGQKCYHADAVLMAANK
jgi:hypothetical protein